jgi:hypothetical protein
MTGTNSASGTEQDDRAPLPFIAEVQERQRDIAMRRAEPWAAPVEARRAARRRDMEILRLSSLEAALHLTEYIAGRLPNWKRAALEDIANPVAALANLNRSIVQICLAEDRFDESAEERAARIKAEAEAQAKAERAAEAERAHAADQVRRTDNKRQAQQAIRAITLSTLRLTLSEREKLLSGLFRQLDATDAYEGDPAEAVADACILIGADPADPARHAADHRERRTRLVALARLHIAALRGSADGDGDEAETGDEDGDEDETNGEDAPIAIGPFNPPAKAQGPPN